MAEEGTKKWDAALEIVMKVAKGKKGSRTKFAAEVGKKKVEYFRGRDFKEWVLENGTGLIKNKCGKALANHLDGRAPEREEDVQAIGAALMEKGFIDKAMYQPMNQSKESDKKPKKWPDRLVKIGGRDFDTEGYYMIRWEGSTTWRNIQIGGGIFACVAISAWTAWPFWLKVALWYSFFLVSEVLSDQFFLYFIFFGGIQFINFHNVGTRTTPKNLSERYVLLGIITLYILLECTRMSCFSLVWIVGYDFWIFPNLNDEYLGFFDSFKPVWSLDRRRDSSTGILVRFVALGMLGVAVDQIAKNHSLSDVQDFVNENFNGLADWGKEYMRPQLMGGKGHVPSIAFFEEQEKLEQEEEAKKAAASVAAGSAGAEGSGQEAEYDDDGFPPQDADEVVEEVN